MPINAAAGYFAAKEHYDKAKSPAERMAALEEMIREAPTHKGAEKLRGQLKRKLADLKKAQMVAARKKGGPSSLYSIRKLGAAQAVLLGYPGAGKSSVLAALTNAKPAISPTPYTTRMPEVGTLKFSNMDFQLVDLPAVVPGLYATGKYGELFGLLRNADCIALVLDARCAQEQFAGLAGELRAGGVPLRRIVVIANKMDLVQKGLHLESCPFPVIKASASRREGLGQLAGLIWGSLGKIRIYTRKASSTDERPMVMDPDSTVRDAVRLVHKGLLETFRFARVWRPGSPHTGARVGLDFRLRDGDAVEIFA